MNVAPVDALFRTGVCSAVRSQSQRRSHGIARWLPASAFVLALLLAPGGVQPQQTAAPATAAPLTKTEMAHFLATAGVVKHKDIPKGVTGPVRLTLSDGTLVHDADFQFRGRAHPGHEV